MNQNSSFIRRHGASSRAAAGPRDDQFPGGAASKNGRSPEPRRQARILIVEDERTIREAMAALLEEEGYGIETSENGKQALHRLYRGPAPDLILLDLRMPVMDGWEFRANQRSDPNLAPIPVVAVSADGSAQAVAIHADAYLRKPLETSVLLSTIRRILIESEHRQMSARLEEAERLASLGRLAAGVGHEINNPLAFVRINVTLALDKARKLTEADPGLSLQLREQQLRGIVEMLEDTKIGVDRINHTIQGLQSLSRKGEEPRGPVSLEQVLDESVSMTWNHLRHRARLIKSYGAIPQIRGNANRLGQVFLNLLVNAAYAIREGHAENNAITIATRTEGMKAVVEIHDTGEGISADVLPHIFDPFFTTKPVGEGTGLGLAISHQVVTEHGGRIEAESEPGKGTTFRIILPLSGETSGALPDPPALSRAALQPPAARARVLVIDDEPLIGRAIQGFLQTEHDVVTETSAADALDRLKAGEKFDIILCDILMPDMTGPDMHTELSTQFPEMVPRLVFMTGGIFTEAATEFVDRVKTPVLYKPFDIKEVRALVASYVSGTTIGDA